MILQTFFPDMGIEEQLATQGRVLAEQIAAVERLERHAAKMKNWLMVTDCMQELAQLQECADALRKLSLPAAGQAAKAIPSEPRSSELPVKQTGGRGDPRLSLAGI